MKCIRKTYNISPQKRIKREWPKPQWPCLDRARDLLVQDLPEFKIRPWEEFYVKGSRKRTYDRMSYLLKIEFDLYQNLTIGMSLGYHKDQTDEERYEAILAKVKQGFEAMVKDPVLLWEHQMVMEAYLA